MRQLRGCNTQTSVHTVRCLRENNISLSKKIRRGTQAGRKKRRAIPVIINSYGKEIKHRTNKTIADNLIVLTGQGKRDNNTFKVGLLNARSVSIKAILICDYILDHDFDIFCITESLLTSEEDPALAHLFQKGMIITYTCDQIGLEGVLSLFSKNN